MLSGSARSSPLSLAACAVVSGPFIDLFWERVCSPWVLNIWVIPAHLWLFGSLRKKNLNSYFILPSPFRMKTVSVEVSQLLSFLPVIFKLMPVTVALPSLLGCSAGWVFGFTVSERLVREAWRHRCGGWATSRPPSVCIWGEWVLYLDTLWTLWSA